MKLPLDILFKEPLPDKSFKLLVFLASEASSGGECTPGYHAMRKALKDYENSPMSSAATVRKWLKFLKHKGWIFRMQRTMGRMAIYLQIPKRFRPQKYAKPVIVEFPKTGGAIGTL